MKVITIGRSQECNIVVNDEKVSRVHLQLVQDDNGNVSVVDLGSTNGTWVNDNRISGEMRLNQGDRIRVGNTFLQWQNYFVANSGNGEQNATTSHGDQQPKAKRTLMWIIVAAVAVLFVAGGTIWILHEQHIKNSEKEAAERNAKKCIEQSEIEAAAAKAQVEYEEARRRALETKSEEDMKRADSLKTVANAKLRESQILYETEKEKVTNLGNDLKETEGLLSNERSLKEKYFNENKLNQERLNDSTKKITNLQNEIKEKNEEAILIKEFYSLMQKANEKSVRSIFEQMQGDSAKNKTDELKRAYIMELFDKAKNNDERKKVLGIVKSVVASQNSPATTCVVHCTSCTPDLWVKDRW